MKVSVILALLLAAVVYGSPRDRALHNLGAVPAASASVAYVGGEWLGNVQCTFHLENDCELSVHAAGRRIDSATHAANEEVLLSCLSSSPSIDLIIHTLAISDIQDYTCLQDTNREFANVWLNVLPVIEPTGPFVHSGEVTLTCNAPTGAILYWQISGAQADHTGLVISEGDAGGNATTAITFTIGDADHFAEYSCCVKAQAGQPPNEYCSTFVVTDEESIQTVSTKADYSAARFDLSVDLHSTPPYDAATASWLECIDLPTPMCDILSTAYYEITDDSQNYHLSSDLQIFDDGLGSTYRFSVATADASVSTTIDFTVNRLSYFPIVTQLPSQVFYNQADGTYSVVLKATVGASPAATISWQQHFINRDSAGTVDITTGGIYTVTTTASSETESETTLVISTYDASLQDVIYTVVADNANGNTTLDIDVTIGPSYLTLTKTDADSFLCKFESFPNAVYEINIVSAYTTSYVVSSTIYDPLYSTTELTIDVTSDPLNTYYQFTCTAYNPHDATNFKSEFISVIPPP